MKGVGPQAPNQSHDQSACAPVLLLGFNRPGHFKGVVSEVLRARPVRLYIAIDGPRASHPQDQIKNAEIRELVRAIDYPTVDLKVLCRDENLGCRRAVSEAIDWFFEHEEAGIVLEDDCLPKPDFFRYCTEMLEHWSDDERVFTISGTGVLSGSDRVAESYAFSKIAYIWGWATWRRAWREYHGALDEWQNLRKTDWIKGPSQGYRDHERYWRNAFDGLLEGRIDSWAYQWTLAHWIGGGLCAVPTTNLVRNTGFGEEATHTLNSSLPKWMVDDDALEFPLRHPPTALAVPSVDRYISRRHFRTMYPRAHPQTLLRRLRRGLGTLLRGLRLR